MKQDNPSDAERILDSPVNTKHANSDNEKSLTNDESASTQPNAEPTKPSFKRDDTQDDARHSGQFDGTVGI